MLERDFLLVCMCVCVCEYFAQDHHIFALNKFFFTNLKFLLEHTKHFVVIVLIDHVILVKMQT